MGGGQLTLPSVLEAAPAGPTDEDGDPLFMVPALAADGGTGPEPTPMVPPAGASSPTASGDMIAAAIEAAAAAAAARGDASTTTRAPRTAPAPAPPALVQLTPLAPIPVPPPQQQPATSGVVAASAPGPDAPTGNAAPGVPQPSTEDGTDSRPSPTLQSTRLSPQPPFPSAVGGSRVVRTAYGRRTRAVLVMADPFVVDSSVRTVLSVGLVIAYGIQLYRFNARRIEAAASAASARTRRWWTSLCCCCLSAARAVVLATRPSISQTHATATGARMPVYAIERIRVAPGPGPGRAASYDDRGGVAGAGGELSDEDDEPDLDTGAGGDEYPIHSPSPRKLIPNAQPQLHPSTAAPENTRLRLAHAAGAAAPPPRQRTGATSGRTAVSRQASSAGSPPAGSGGVAVASAAVAVSSSHHRTSTHIPLSVVFYHRFGFAASVLLAIWSVDTTGYWGVLPCWFTFPILNIILGVLFFVFTVWLVHNLRTLSRQLRAPAAADTSIATSATAAATSSSRGSAHSSLVVIGSLPVTIGPILAIVSFATNRRVWWIATTYINAIVLWCLLIPSLWWHRQLAQIVQSLTSATPITTAATANNKVQRLQPRDTLQPQTQTQPLAASAIASTASGAETGDISTQPLMSLKPTTAGPGSPPAPSSYKLPLLSVASRRASGKQPRTSMTDGAGFERKSASPLLLLRRAPAATSNSAGGSGVVSPQPRLPRLSLTLQLPDATNTLPLDVLAGHMKRMQQQTTPPAAAPAAVSTTPDAAGNNTCAVNGTGAAPLASARASASLLVPGPLRFPASPTLSAGSGGSGGSTATAASAASSAAARTTPTGSSAASAVVSTSPTVRASPPLASPTPPGVAALHSRQMSSLALTSGRASAVAGPAMSTPDRDELREQSVVDHLNQHTPSVHATPPGHAAIPLAIALTGPVPVPELVVDTNQKIAAPAPGATATATGTATGLTLALPASTVTATQSGTTSGESGAAFGSPPLLSSTSAMVAVSGGDETKSGEVFSSPLANPISEVDRASIPETTTPAVAVCVPIPAPAVHVPTLVTSDSMSASSSSGGVVASGNAISPSHAGDGSDADVAPPTNGVVSAAATVAGPELSAVMRPHHRSAASESWKDVPSPALVSDEPSTSAFVAPSLPFLLPVSAVATPATTVVVSTAEGTQTPAAPGAPAPAPVVHSPVRDVMSTPTVITVSHRNGVAHTAGAVVSAPATANAGFPFPFASAASSGLPTRTGTRSTPLTPPPPPSPPPIPDSKSADGMFAPAASNGSGVKKSILTTASGGATPQPPAPLSQSPGQASTLVTVLPFVGISPGTLRSVHRRFRRLRIWLTSALVLCILLTGYYIRNFHTEGMYAEVAPQPPDEFDLVRTIATLPLYVAFGIMIFETWLPAPAHSFSQSVGGTAPTIAAAAPAGTGAGGAPAGEDDEGDAIERSDDVVGALADPGSISRFTRSRSRRAHAARRAVAAAIAASGRGTGSGMGSTANALSNGGWARAFSFRRRSPNHTHAGFSSGAAATLIRSPSGQASTDPIAAAAVAAAAAASATPRDASNAAVPASGVAITPAGGMVLGAGLLPSSARGSLRYSRTASIGSGGMSPGGNAGAAVAPAAAGSHQPTPQRPLSRSRSRSPRPFLLPSALQRSASQPLVAETHAGLAIRSGSLIATHTSAAGGGAAVPLLPPDFAKVLARYE